jgi:NAD(P)-dependent dehydrogenase (short-subunit alcohol dehydrogenase family)
MGMLEGKAVVITGAGNGIGAACARGVARQGAAVVVNDIDAARAERTVAAIGAEGGTAIPCVADVTDYGDAGRLVETCVARFGKIDGLVNNAALFHWTRIETFDPAAARALVDVNVLGPLYCTARALEPMLRQRSGSIVNVVSGALMGLPKMYLYGATKGAVASMIYAGAIDLAGTGVRINGLSPLGAMTGMTTPSADELAEDPSLASRSAAVQPAEFNSPVVEYLLSDRAAHVTGQILRRDREELQIYTHPALLLPAVLRPEWTAAAIADAFDHEFKDRLIPCGVFGMTDPPIALTSGYHDRVARAGAGSPDAQRSSADGR